jgi:hypothetical protein
VDPQPPALHVLEVRFKAWLSTEFTRVLVNVSFDNMLLIFLICCLPSALNPMMILLTTAALSPDRYDDA